MKNLAAITTRADDLARVVLVDNLSVSFALQPDNGIPIADFIDDPRDSELARVLALLNELASEADVRPVLARRFGLADSETMRSLRQRIDGGDPNPRETLGRGSRL
jgi:CTD small phosphatase-like protein 2